ncbi:metalloregulator ArsR/SmtB family transcription factor [Simiduia curdlanivorans]|uniref:Metalloregulator ArsR/SmtB family transcription factor n=1 Tax=Simiduia curdlanivorans TaxID=1492769 RepID=A0ABV8V728_9GAMM|nr:metalloregulator ArsR/SmtB family transcription factor [Simiduia curdlanivorans]MDN3639062.1 metalloregulator ArsR/SmtB family transcription factor [Simiduia curdlanivorans]
MSTQEDYSALAEHAGSAAALLKQLANPHRLMLLCTLIDGELSVGELNARVPLSQSALSQHLAGLREANLVSTRKDRQQVFYRLEGTEAVSVIRVLKQLYCG